MYKDTLAALAKVVSTIKCYYDRHHSHAPKYKAGDLVYLEASHLHMDHPF